MLPTMTNDTHPDLNMADSSRDTPALLIIDMVKDNLDPANHSRGALGACATPVVVDLGDDL